MKLLVITQKVDKNDSNLGFFHMWLEKLAKQVEQLYVICLGKGEYDLPVNVDVVSLGKEKGSASTLRYALRFYACLWKLRGKYDNVFVHMNPEYVILGGLFWRFTGKKVLLWYTHKAVNLRLLLAEKFATKIFTASKESFRLPTKKVTVVGHGIPVEFFAEQRWEPGYGRSGNPPSTIFPMTAGRISPAKDLKTFFSAIAELGKESTSPIFCFGVYGRPITKDDIEYKKKIEDFAVQLGLKLSINDIGNSYNEMPMIYQAHHFLIHTSRTGSLDKVVLEALASGRIVVTSSGAYADAVKEGVVYTFSEGNYQELANTIEKICKAGILAPDRLPNQKAIEYVKKHHNLDNLIAKIIDYFTL